MFRQRWLEKKYGVTADWYDRKLAEQGGHCALCEVDCVANRKYLFVDHNHETGAVRGILCYRCNTFVGQIEKKGWIESALAYLARYS